MITADRLALLQQLSEKSPVVTRETLFEQIILPIFQSYPEIAWFADDHVAATNEGPVASSSGASWTAMLVQKGLLPKTSKKYIELERMLQSIVAFHLLLREDKGGIGSAYTYWIQGQKLSVALTREDFQALQKLARTYAGTEKDFKILEASLVYSDLGKTPEARRRAKVHGITQADHDDFMAAIYAAPKAVREYIIPSLANLHDNVRESLIRLHTTIRVHWGHVSQLEGGVRMFSQLQASREEIQTSDFHQASLIQVCDVAAARAHADPRGLVAFDHPTHRIYQRVFTVTESMLEKEGNAETALLELTNAQVKDLGLAFDQKLGGERALTLARIGAFLSLHNKDQGRQLQEAARILTDPDWRMLVEIFGLKTGVNTWKRNPTYMPAVLLNLFNSSSEPKQYESALNGALVLAKIAQAYQKKGLQDSETPLCFNKLAGQASAHPEWFETFSVDNLDWSDPINITILAPTP